MGSWIACFAFIIRCQLSAVPESLPNSHSPFSLSLDVLKRAHDPGARRITIVSNLAKESWMKWWLCCLLCGKPPAFPAELHVLISPEGAPAQPARPARSGLEWTTIFRKGKAFAQDTRQGRTPGLRIEDVMSTALRPNIPTNGQNDPRNKTIENRHVLRLPSVSRLSSLLLVVCLLGGCAAEGPPHPPQIQRPVRIDDLTVVQTGRIFRLSFKRPLLTTDGRRLTKPIDVSIFRQLTPHGETVPGPFIAVKPWVSLPAQELAAELRGPNIVYDAPLSTLKFRSQVGTTFSFMVITATRGFRGRLRESDPSNVARIKLLDVSPPLQALRLTQSPDALELRWSPPTRGLTGGPLPAITGYLVFRSTKPASGSYALLARTVATEYEDRDFQFNQTYYYRVQALFKDEGAVAESASSSPVDTTPHDIFPPPVPSRLMAVYTGRSVQLVWQPVVARNLAGYNVYRLELKRQLQHLNEVLLRSPAFTDNAVDPRHQYSYWVTSVSVAHNESRLSREATVDTR